MGKNEYTIGQNAHKKQDSMPGPRGMAAGEKPKDFKKTWGKLLRYSRSHLAVIIIALICAAGGAVLTLLGPGMLSEMTDIVTGGLMTGIDLSAIAGIGMALAVMYGVSALLSFSQGLIMATVTQKISKSLRTEISKKVNTLPIWYYNKTDRKSVV